MNRSGTKDNRLQFQRLDKVLHLQSPWAENQLLLQSAGDGKTETSYPSRPRMRGSQYRVRR